MSDLTIGTIIRQLKESTNEKWITPLLRDMDTGEYYIMQDGVYKDEDGDIIIPIKLL